jgi:hypothetical protein
MTTHNVIVLVHNLKTTCNETAAATSNATHKNQPHSHHFSCRVDVTLDKVRVQWDSARTSLVIQGQTIRFCVIHATTINNAHFSVEIIL